MIQALETAVGKVKALPAKQQEYAARLLEHIAASEGSLYHVPREHREAVLKGLRQAKQKKFASDAAVKRALRMKWA